MGTPSPFISATSWVASKELRALAALRFVSRRIDRVLNAALRQHGLSSAQLHLLATIAGGTQKLSEIRRRLGVTQANVTGLVAQLESAGFVSRSGIEEDHRVTFLRLTSNGRRAYGKASELASSLVHVSLRGVSRKGIDDLIGVLTDVSECVPEWVD